MAHPLTEPRTVDAARNDAQERVAHEPAGIAPLRLPVISRAAARVTRTVCDARLAMRAEALCGLTQLCAEVTDAQAVDAAYADPAVIELAVALPSGAGSAALRVALDLQAYPALAIAAWPDRDAQQSGPQTIGTIAAPLVANTSADIALRNAVAGVVLEPLLTQLTRFGFTDSRVVSVRRRRLQDAPRRVPREPRDESAHRLHSDSYTQASAVALSFVHEARRFDLAVSADPRCYDLLDSLLQSDANAQDAPAAPQPHADLAIPGRLIIGVKPLPVETLNALDTGDVLLRALFPSFDATLFAANDAPARSRPRAVAAWGTPGLTRLCAAVELDGQSLVIVKEPNMSEELDPANADAGLAIDQPEDPIRIGELELPVQFEIDTVALPLAQLSALGPGYVVELPVAAADAQLRLVAHGQTIGYGELVTVGEHLGIRIIRMAHRHGPVQ
ncbi:type III secretion system cytoplasmic ring protein SctQ [Paraburkholderia sp. BCC1885]|uniref:type III secretion system cytoplasmic ring protein SctQ n=1 Tax=Paraburkholderia sp. BCC1885 TaxID=2562669 RepID=UPI001183E5FE|nr:type III secretion system cytoplasmic ring protein SctQ [Paraburkholderia sp. BCC1885]